MERNLFENIASFNLESLLIDFNNHEVLIEREYSSDEKIKYGKDKYFILDEIHLSSYFHEYIHAFHYFNTRFYIEGLCSYLLALLRMSNHFHEISKISLPVTNIDDFEEIIYWNSWYRLCGDNFELEDDLNFRFIDSEIISSKCTFLYGSNCFDRKLPVIEISNGNKYRIGEAVINECIAYNLEKILGRKDLSEYPNYPYKVVEKISENILGKTIKPIHLILICERSLQTYSPGEMLIEIINKIKAININVENYEELKNFLYENIILNNDYYNLSSNIEISLLKILYESEKYDYYPILKFIINEILTSQSQLKTLKQPVYLEVFNDSKFDIKKFYILITLIKPVSLIKDKATLEKKGYGSFYPDEYKDISSKTFSFFKSLEYLLNLLYRTSNRKYNLRCPFYNYCTHESIINQSCVELPWDKSISSGTCEVVFAAAFLGLLKKELDFDPNIFRQ